MKPSTLDVFNTQYDAIVESIYRAAGGVIAWREPLTLIGSIFGAASLQIVCIDREAGAPIFIHESAPNDAAEGQSPYIARVSETDETRITLVLFPGANRAALSDAEKAALNRIAGHFGRALELQKSLGLQSNHRALAQDLLEKLGQPIFVIDRARRIIYHNRRAEALLGRGDLIVDRGGRVACRDAISDSELGEAMDQFAPVSDVPLPRRILLKLLRKDGIRIAAAMQPMEESLAGAGQVSTQLLFTIFEPSATIPIDSAVLSAAFDLTPAEAGVASLIANGRSPEDCSEEMGVKISTVRSQLVSLYGKTGASGQADLIRTILSTASPPLSFGNCFPQRPLRVIVPFPPGGTTDMIVRSLAQEMTKSLGQRVVIEYHAGDATVAGIAAGAKAAPDGYTLVSVATSFAVNHSLVRSLPYDSLRDLQPVSLLARNPLVLVGDPHIPAKTLSQLVEYLRSRPNRLRYGSLGAGTTQHVSAEAFKAAADVRITHVPFGNQTEAIRALLGQCIELLFGNFLDVLPYMRSGKLRPFGVTTPERMELAPDLPTIAEQGYPGFEFYGWFGLEAPAGVPEDIVAILNREIAQGLLRTKLRQSLGSRGMDAIAGTPQQFDRFMRSEMARYGRLIREVGIKA